MNCLKCGREIDEGQVFCGDCLLDMQKDPVKPGVPVLLPPQAKEEPSQKAHPRRRGKPTPDDQIRSLRIRVRVLAALLAVCVVLLAVLSLLRLRSYRKGQPLPGQNYSAVSASDGAEGE